MPKPKPKKTRTAAELRATLRAHEETIGRLRAALDGLLNVVLHPDEPDGTWRQHSLPWHCEQARGALATAPPGEYEERVRRDERDKVLAGTKIVSDAWTAERDADIRGRALEEAAKLAESWWTDKSPYRNEWNALTDAIAAEIHHRRDPERHE